jgi:hypothetical protein
VTSAGRRSPATRRSAGRDARAVPEPAALPGRNFAGACDWWIAEYDPATGTAFGYACLGDPACAEWGYLDLPELERVSVRSGLLIVERDLHWAPPPAARAVLPGRHAR